MFEQIKRQLRQVLTNLISNGIKFTRQGGVTVRLDYDTYQLRLIVEVQDTGIGIAEAELDHVFDIFTQSTSGQEAQEGTGLGLPISRHFVRLMGGEIRVRSMLDQGSTFSFDIYAEPATSTPSDITITRREVIGLAPGQPVRHILVVEDKWESRTLLVKLLEPMGFDVLTAADGQEAIDLYEAHTPDLIFMDMRMPILDGYEATRRIKATPQGQQIPIIALTASAFEHERTQILACGCDDFIRKPLNAAEIFAKISRHLAVSFIYKGQTGELPLLEAQPTLTPEDLMCLSADSLARLHHAAMAANADEALAVIEEIRLQAPALAEGLAHLTHSFRFDILMELTDPPVTN